MTNLILLCQKIDNVASIGAADDSCQPVQHRPLSRQTVHA